MMYRTLPIIIISSATLLAQQAIETSWERRVESPTTISYHASVPGYCESGKFVAIIEIRDASGENETLSFNILFTNSSISTLLNISKFEDIDPNSRMQPLIIRSHKSNKVFRFHVNGIWTDDDVFKIENAILLTEKHSTLYRFFESAANSDDLWTIEIKNPPKWNRSAHLSFSFGGAKEFLRSFIFRNR
jgi:hypothetical protein